MMRGHYTGEILKKSIPNSEKYKTQYKYYEKVKNTEAYKKAQKARISSYLKNIEKTTEKHICVDREWEI